LELYKVEKIKACMESTGTYSLAFADYLFSQNHEVSIVNPACINAFAKSKLSRHKTDKVDSKIIAEYASKYELKPYKPTDPAAAELRSLYNAIINLESAYRKMQNYLESREQLASTVISIYEKLSSNLLQEIAKLEQKIDDLLDNTPNLKKDIDNIQTIPGIGKKTAVAVISSVTNINLFEDARQLAAFAGLTPKDYQSGSSIKKKSKISKMGSSRLRKALYFPAMSAMQHNASMKSFAKKLKLKGKCGKVTVVAVMRKLLHIIFGVIKHKKPYDASLAHIGN
jgi:transposase